MLLLFQKKKKERLKYGWLVPTACICNSKFPRCETIKGISYSCVCITHRAERRGMHYTTRIDACRFSSLLTWGHDSLREARPSDRSYCVAVDVVLVSLYGQCVCQTQHAQLRCAVVGLTKVTVDAGGRGRHDDSGQRRAEATSQ